LDADESGMKRLLIFALLGPIVGLVPMIVALGLPESNALPVMLVAAYVIGEAPAMLAGGVDWFLASRLSALARMAVTACAGFGFSLIPAFVLNNIARESHEFILIGIAGAVSAAVCSWLVGKAA
jgi:hypothetical protein